MKYPLILLILALAFNSCLQDEPFKLEFAGFEPKAMPNDWQISSPENENMDREGLEKAYELVYRDDRFTMARSLLVFRNGKLVAEAYPHDPADIHAIHNIQSCTKSITSMLTGIAVQNQELGSLDERLYDIFPEDFDEDENKRAISIRDALTMQTGLAFDNGKHSLQLYQTKASSVAYVLSQDLLYRPGTVMNYNDGAPQLVSKVIEKKTGKSLEQYAAEKLFSPLGITDWKWELAEDGTTFGAFSLFLKPRDFGKIGQLLLQQGKWGHKALLDTAYLTQATQTHVAANFHSEPYGYYYWIMPAYQGFAALGHGGQFLFVAPEQKLVIVYTAWPYTSGQFFDQGNELMAIIHSSCH